MPGNGSTTDFLSKIRHYSDCTDDKGCMDFFIHFCSAEGIGCIIVFKPEQHKDLSKLYPTEV